MKAHGLVQTRALPQVEQALKDAAREKIVLNDEHYRGGWDELHRLRADLLELATDLVAKDECCTALSAATLADLVLTQASRTRNGADAYFTAKVWGSHRKHNSSFWLCCSLLLKQNNKSEQLHVA
jgi:hypothetical protein